MRCALISVLVTYLCIGVVPSVPAYEGLIDGTFGSSGLALTAVAKNSPISGPVVQDDGKVLFCGATDVAPSGTRVLVVRLTASGTVDPDFHFTAFDFGAGPTASCTGIALQSDGKIVVAGPGFNVARLLSDGTLDTVEFGGGTGKASVAFSAGAATGPVRVAIDAQQRIVLAGTIVTASHGDDFAIARFDSGGSPDLTFNLSGTVSYGFDTGGAGNNDIATGLAIDSANRIVVGGYADAIISSHAFAILRLTEHGALDPNFGPGGKKSFVLGYTSNDDDRALGLLIERGGGVVLVGRASIPGLTGDTGLSAVRLRDDGSLDTAFATAGKYQPDLKLTDPTFAEGVAAIEQENGKILFAGKTQIDAAGHSIAVTLRTNDDGSPDTSYGGNGERSYDFALTSPSSQATFGLAFQGTQVIVANEAFATDGSNTTVAVLMRLSIDLLFADGFE